MKSQERCTDYWRWPHMVDREALQETGEGEVVIFPLHWPWCWRMHQQWGVTSGQEQGFRGPSRQTHHCTDHPTQPPPPFLPSPWPRWELANGSGLSVNIFFLYQRHIFQPLSKGGWLPWRGKGDKKRVREWGWNFPPSPSFLHSRLHSTSGTVYHLACWFRQERKGWRRNSVPAREERSLWFITSWIRFL